MYTTITHTHTTHTQARAQALSACRWGHMQARRVACAGRDADERILTDVGALARSLLRVTRRILNVQRNQLTTLPATVFNGLSNLE